MLLPPAMGAQQFVNVLTGGTSGVYWDVANAALFLATDGSKYVTGIELVVDGDIPCKVG